VNLLPLTRETENVLDHRALSCLPRGASVINLGRGQHVVDEDLLDLVDAKHIAAATLDAFRTEPLPVEHPFWTHPAITITPHAARRLDVDGIARRVALQWHRLNADQPLEGLVDRAAGY
jgi:glyoxylate/hydroxypyruvate reductase A